MTKHTVVDNSDLRKYFAAIPNIVLTLGLNPFELTLYVHLKRAAGDSGGACWKSTATMGRECHMSTGMISKTKASLSSPRDALNGKPLITVSEQMQHGGHANHSITITDIWPENMAALERVHSMKAEPTSSLNEGAHSPHEPARSYSEGTRSPHDYKEKHIEEKPFKKNPEEELKELPFAGAAFVAALIAFKAHRREIRAPLTDRAEVLLCRKLAGWPEDVATRALADAVIGGYQGVFEPRQNGNGHGSKADASVQAGRDWIAARMAKDD